MDIQNVNLQTALHLAVERQHTQVVRVMNILYYSFLVLDYKGNEYVVLLLDYKGNEYIELLLEYKGNEYKFLLVDCKRDEYILLLLDYIG